MNEERRQFQIYLPGLLRLLAENLYSNKKVAIRELIQNAHDSCTRRRTEGRESNYHPRIDIVIDRLNRVIRITDNGSGLTADEVTEYLSTIGRSYTRQLGEQLSVLSPEEANKLIGQFGLGFLSAFLVAESVTLTTQSMKADHPTLCWRSTGDIHYEVRETGKRPVGTEVQLHLKPEASFLLNDRVLRETVQQYADFLEIPIYFEPIPTPVNTMTPPWERPDTETASYDYIGRVFGTHYPLGLIPLRDHTINLGHDTIRIPMQGFLFVPPGSVASVQEYGDMQVFIKRMFICSGQRDLLPSWARFVRGVIDCPFLQPTASREELQQEENFHHVQRALEEQLIAGLKDIARYKAKTWQQIVHGHRGVMMSWAAREEDFFNEVADIVTFRTSRGDTNLPDYLRSTNRTLYYTRREIGSLQEKLLGEGYGVPVIDASWDVEYFFLEKYVKTNRHLKLVQLDDDSYQLLQPVSDDQFSALIRYYHDHGIRAKVSRFDPIDVPALMIYPPKAEFIRDTRESLDSGNIPKPFAAFLSDHLSRMNVSDDEMSGTLHLNASNALVRELTASENPAVLNLLYHIARLFAGRMLDTPDVIISFRESTKALNQLMGNKR